MREMSLLNSILTVPPGPFLESGLTARELYITTMPQAYLVVIHKPYTQHMCNDMRGD